MRNLYFLTIACLIAGASGYSQNIKPFTELGVQVCKPSYFQGGETSGAIGLGVDVKREWSLTKKFSLTAGLGYNFFKGDYRYYKFIGASGDTVVKNFAIAPLLAGLKYYLVSNFYISGEVGLVIKANSNASTHLAVVPSAGWMFPAGNSRIDLSIKLTNVIQGYKIPESTSLQRGGYGFWSLRAAYAF